MTINVVKRNGSKVPLDVDRPNAVVIQACKGLEGVSASEVLARAHIQFVDGMPTSRIQEVLIQAAEALITIEEPNYQYVASRLQMYDVRKRAYGTYEPPTFKKHCENMVKLGKYDEEILDFTDEQFKELESYIDHSRDNTFSHAAAGQLVDKYLLRHRTKERAFFESPQMMYMAIAATLLKGDFDKIKDFYDGASLFKFSLPTPIMSAVRTPTRQFSSCVLIKSDDTLDSIAATSTAIVKYISKKAGVGVDASMIRASGADIRNGEMSHTGILPFLKYHASSIKSCSQGGVRGGAGTIYYPMWHYQYDEIIVLKNNKGIEDNRERRVDYGIQVNGEMIRRFLNKEDIWLLDPVDVPEMYESFFADQTQFSIDYEEAISKAKRGEIRGKKLRASEVWDMLLVERSETSRIYLAFVDNMNTHTPFNSKKDTIYQSNLCLEIALPTKPFQHEFDTDGRIALCTLASFNMSAFLDGDDFEDMKRYAEVLVTALDNLLSYQDYPMIQAKLATDEFRTLGIGIVNLDDFLMKKGCKYGSKQGLLEVDKWMERFNYSLTKASNNLAKTRGGCGKWKDLCYVDGTLPWEKRNKNVDKLLNNVTHLPDTLWKELKEDIRTFGIRNATLSAVAPTESSAQVLNATNGVEMPKAPVSIKASKSGLFKQLVPNPEKYQQYEYLWDHATPTEYLKTCAVIQKWVDQAISTNSFYYPAKTEDTLDRFQLMKDIITFYNLGGKTFYYQNVNDGAGDELEPEDEPECDTCVV